MITAVHKCIVAYHGYLFKLNQGCPTFYLPWATLEDENLFWATHKFGLGHMGGQP